MKRQQLSATALSTASPDAVFAVLADYDHWPEWSTHDEVGMERDGPDGSKGVGAVRWLRKGRLRSVEEIVEYQPGRRFSYVLLSGLPLRDYRADVDLKPRDGGTEITWSSSFFPKRLGTGWIYRFALRKFMAKITRNLAEITPRRERAGSRSTEPARDHSRSS